jgi:hypothetical protein
VPLLTQPEKDAIIAAEAEHTGLGDIDLRMLATPLGGDAAAGGAAAAAGAGADAADDGDEVEMTGVAGETIMPHARCHCTIHPFAASADHATHCAQCYCFVCDGLASKCKVWAQHCHATDVGPSAAAWKAEREKLKKARMMSYRAMTKDLEAAVN